MFPEIPDFDHDPLDPTVFNTETSPDELAEQAEKEATEARQAKLELEHVHGFINSDIFKAGLREIRDEKKKLVKEILEEPVEDISSMLRLLHNRGVFRGLARFEEVIEEHIEELTSKANKKSDTQS